MTNIKEIVDVFLASKGSSVVILGWITSRIVSC